MLLSPFPGKYDWMLRIYKLEKQEVIYALKLKHDGDKWCWVKETYYDLIIWRPSSLLEIRMRNG